MRGQGQLSTKGGLRVRLAVEIDLDQVALLAEELDRLHEGLQPGFFATQAGSQKVHARRRSLSLAMRDECQILLVAEEYSRRPDTSLWGFCQVLLSPDRDKALVDRLFVRQDVRGRGCGRLLMKEAARHAKAAGARRMAVTVWEGNEGASAFYRSLGYLPLSTVLGKEL